MGTQAEKDDVNAKIDLIKLRMPDTYKAIQAKAQEIGKGAFGYVRRGLRGEANCFYAFERGHVVGVPFFQPDVTPTMAHNMVAFGASFAVVWHLDACATPTPSVKP